MLGKYRHDFSYRQDTYKVAKLKPECVVVSYCPASHCKAVIFFE